MQSKKITVVTVVKNGETYIERSIESVLRQKTDIPFEYIIFDAMSDDGTEGIITQYINDERIQYFREEDSGPSDALNKAFKKATGDILCWVNSDDYLLENTFEEVLRQFNSNPDIDFLYGDYFTKKGENFKYKKKFAFDKNILYYRYMMMPQPSSFWTKSVYDRSGGIDPTFKFSFDYDLFLRMAHLPNFRAKYILKPLSVFELHDEQITAQGDSGFKKERHKAREKLRTELYYVKRFKKIFFTCKMLYLYALRQLL